jgi:MFS-type transporter involved in bile tolerance (Atg22 family)
MFCHGELALRRPPAEHLTAFYLMISLGGAAGAIFTGLIAPRLFATYIELPIGLVLCSLLALFIFYRKGAWANVAL